MNPTTEIIRENLTAEQVLMIREQAKKEGCRVNINRLHSQLVEIQIIHPNNVIDVSAKLVKVDASVRKGAD